MATDDDVDDFLAHYGVKGMRWGRRKRRDDGDGGGLFKRERSADHIKSREIKKKHVSEMSNAELKALTARLQLEKQLSDLSPSKVERGNKAVKDSLNVVNTANAVIGFVNSPAGKMIGSQIRRAMG